MAVFSDVIVVLVVVLAAPLAARFSDPAAGMRRDFYSSRPEVSTTGAPISGRFPSGLQELCNQLSRPAHPVIRLDEGEPHVPLPARPKCRPGSHSHPRLLQQLRGERQGAARPEALG